MVAEPQKYLFCCPDAGEIAQAAAQAIRGVKADFPVTNMQLAALMGSKDADVIERLENRETKKVPASLFVAISNAFGEQYIKDYMDLMGLRAMPKHVDDIMKAMPALASLVAKMTALAAAGKSLNHTNFAPLAGDVRAADGALAQLRSMMADMGLAA
jgi:hypothetical protein